MMSGIFAEPVGILVNSTRKRKRIVRENLLEDRISADTASAAAIKSPWKSGNKSNASGFSSDSIPKKIACSILLLSFRVFDSADVLESSVKRAGAVTSMERIDAVEVSKLIEGVGLVEDDVIPRNRFVEDRRGKVSSNVEPVAHHM